MSSNLTTSFNWSCSMSLTSLSTCLSMFSTIVFLSLCSSFLSLYFNTSSAAGYPHHTFFHPLFLLPTLLPLSQLAGSGVLGQLLEVLDELRGARKVLAQRLRDVKALFSMSVTQLSGSEHDITHLRCLVVLQDTAHGPRRCAQRRVEAVHVLLLDIRLRLGAVTDL